ncbi:MipA/OmpV family protein [Planctobacterium marinum]|uniref:MipA/OmpV family protein n=1 Tax=Planctobacterium marinum TaxID=1631968 RepID=A0AA48KR49_9ALTE|nr:hypothetical protein MACH26_39970 [Planctobacterium marinum]
MTRNTLIKAAFITLGLVLLSANSLADTVSSEEESRLETFFAVSLIGGVTETNLLDQNFERVDTRDSFLSVNIEMQLRWNGFFYENPGNSQENVNGLFSGDAIGYNFYNNDNWSVDIYGVHAVASGEYVFDTVVPIFDEDGTQIDAVVQRMTLPRKGDFRVGLRATGYFNDYLTQFIATPISIEDEIGGYSFSASIRRTWLYKNWNFYGTVGLNYQSSDIVDYYFGLSETESAQIEAHLRSEDSPFKPYKASGGILAVGQVGFEYPISENFVFGGYFTAVMRPDVVTDSPLSVEGRMLTTAGLSVTYVF